MNNDIIWERTSQRGAGKLDSGCFDMIQDQGYVRRQTLEMVPPGRRRGRPKHTWMHCVNRDMRAIRTTEDEVHDRTGWRRIVSAAATPQEDLTLLSQSINQSINQSIDQTYLFPTPPVHNILQIQSSLAITRPVITLIGCNAVGRASRFFGR